MFYYYIRHYMHIPIMKVFSMFIVICKYIVTHTIYIQISNAYVYVKVHNDNTYIIIYTYLYWYCLYYNSCAVYSLFAFINLRAKILFITVVQSVVCTTTVV